MLVWDWNSSEFQIIYYQNSKQVQAGLNIKLIVKSLVAHISDSV